MPASTDNAVQVIFPYKENGVWMFDDADKGLHKEPFVAGAGPRVEQLAREAGLTTEEYSTGFALFFSKEWMPGSNRYEYDRDSLVVVGAMYRDEEDFLFWLCPALLKYFAEVPEVIYARGERKAV